MNYGNIENSLNNDYNNNSNYNYSLEISKDNCYINNNPINNYLSDNNSNYYNIDGENNDDFKKYRSKRNKLCNLNNPKLIQAYNEGYYGVNNVPKQYYIYPRFANYKPKEERNNEQFYEKQSTNNNYYILKSIENNNEYKSKHNNNINSFNNNTFKNNVNDELSSYLNYPYPYPKLINLSSNLFGKLHSIDSKQNSKLLNSNNYIINQNEENLEKEKKSQGINDISNQTFNKKEDKNLSNKASEKVIVSSNNKKNKEKFGKESNYQYDEIKNGEKRINNYDDYDLDNTGNFYYINNTITERSVPYKNIPDNISIDDEAEDKI